MTAATDHLLSSLLPKSASLKTFIQIHALVHKSAFDTDPFFFANLLLHCAVAISDTLGHAHRLFLHFPNPDAFMYNTLIRSLAGSDSPQNALLLFRQMRWRSVNADSFSFAFTIKAATSYRSLTGGMQLYCQGLSHGLHSHVVV